MTRARMIEKSRVWADVAYPDSVPEDWVERLESAHVPACVSPIHDKDVNADGTLKKPHWHILAQWPGPVTAKTAAEFFALAGITCPPERVSSLQGYARYLTHRDNPEKAQYDSSGVLGLSGFDYLAAVGGVDVDGILTAIEDWIDEQKCWSYRGLCVYARRNKPDWLRVIRHSTIHLTAYQRSGEWEQDQQDKAKSRWRAENSA